MAFRSRSNAATAPRTRENRSLLEQYAHGRRVLNMFCYTGGFSFYANNLLYHEPWKSTSRSNTLTQQNAGSFSFGVELYFNL